MSDLEARAAFVPTRFLVREAAIVTLVALLWILEARFVDETGLTARAVQILTGLVTIVPAALLHEYGHLIGARLSGSVVRFPEGLRGPLLFDFDVERNDRRQFLAMSFGGYAGSLVGLVVLWTSLPPGRLASWLALAGAVIGLGVTLFIELPHTLQVLRGGPLPKPLVTVTKR